MTFQRIFSIYALIILFFFASVTILLFTLFDNQSWRTIACFFLFPLLAALITLFIAALIFPSPQDRTAADLHKVRICRITTIPRLRTKIIHPTKIACHRLLMASKIQALPLSPHHSFQT